MVQQVLLYPDFLDTPTCQDILSQLSDCPTEAAPVAHYGPKQHELRRTHLLKTPPALDQRVVAPLEALSNTLAAHFKCVLTHHETPQFLRYDPGDYFGLHSDTLDQPIYRNRRISVIFCLNDHRHYTGGQLIFALRHPSRPEQFLGVPVPPQAGLLIAFHPGLLHEVKPVAAGSRYTVVTWLSGLEHNQG